MKIFLILVFVSSILLLNAIMLVKKENLTESIANQIPLPSISLTGHNDNTIDNIDNYFSNENNNRTKRFFTDTDIISELTNIFQRGFKKCGLDNISDMIFLTPEVQQKVKECVDKKTHDKVKALEDILRSSYGPYAKQVVKSTKDQFNAIHRNKSNSAGKQKSSQAKVDANKTSSTPATSPTTTSTTKPANNRTNNDNKGIMIYMNFTSNNKEKTFNKESSKKLKQLLTLLPETLKSIIDKKT